MYRKPLTSCAALFVNDKLPERGFRESEGSRRFRVRLAVNERPRKLATGRTQSRGKPPHNGDHNRGDAGGDGHNPDRAPEPRAPKPLM